MQIGVIPIPPTFRLPIDRRCSMSVENLMRQLEPDPYFYGEGPANDVHHLTLGSLVENIPLDLKKAIYVSRDQQWVFETVFANEGNQSWCLYTKVIQHDVDIAISLRAIDHYRSGRETLVPLTYFIRDLNWRCFSKIEEQDLHSLVNPVFDREALDKTIIELADFGTDLDYNKQNVSSWRPLYEHVPLVLEALIIGRFYRNPCFDLQFYNPYIKYQPQVHSLAARLKYEHEAYQSYLFRNHTGLDDITLRLIKLRPSEFSVSLSFSFAMEKSLDTAVVLHYNDPYENILPLSPQQEAHFKTELASLFHDCLWLYSQCFDVNVFEAIGNTRKISHITISKNMSDEVLVDIHDFHNDVHASYHTSFMAMALATRSVGNYL